MNPDIDLIKTLKEENKALKDKVRNLKRHMNNINFLIFGLNQNVSQIMRESEIYSRLKED